jgi:hypothetical protein
VRPDDSRRLEVARRIWFEAQPSDEEIERAVQRMQARAARPRRRSAHVRVGPAFAVAVALIAVLAYAAPGSRSRLGELSRKVFGSGATGTDTAAVSPRPSRLTLATGTELAPRSASADSVGSIAAASPEPAFGTPGGERSADSGRERERGSGAPASVRPRGATWQDVNRALAAGDDAQAASALRELEQSSPDGATRAKARLGLAQLALGRGDCSMARRMARSVAATPNLDEKLVHRAHTVLLRCELR